MGITSQCGSSSAAGSTLILYCMKLVQKGPQQEMGVKLKLKLSKV